MWGKAGSKESLEWGGCVTNPSLLRLWLIFCLEPYLGLSHACRTEQDGKDASSQMKRGTLSSSLGMAGFGQAWRKCCCSHQDTGEKPRGGRLQIWKEKGKIKRLMEEIPLEFDRTVDAKMEVRQKSGNRFEDDQPGERISC